LALLGRWAVARTAGGPDNHPAAVVVVVVVVVVLVKEWGKQ
jgi:hypothetical protein